MPKARHRRMLGLLVAALVAVLLPAVPASANHAPAPSTPKVGSGTLHGTELVEDQVFLGQPCFAATRTVFGLGGEGTFAGRKANGDLVVYRAQLADGQAVKDGPLRLEVENTQPYHHGPKGTHGADSSCGDATAGTPVPAQFRVFAAGNVYKLDGGGAQVPCVGTGSFVRTGMYSSQNWHADWTLDEDCVVVGNAAGTPGVGVAPRYSAFTHVGQHDPCFGGACTKNIQVDYGEHFPVAGLAVSVGGPATAPIGQTATVTAGVTDDGAPVSGAAVAFTVRGPAPTAPAGGSGATGTDGRAGFTFTAAVAGDYVVTASATSTGHPAQVVTGTHTVRFNNPAPRMTLVAPPRAQTEDPLQVVATVVDDNNPVPGDPPSDPIPGVSVAFTVAGSGRGRPTPASGTAVTDAFGQAKFTFSGDRAGDYTVTASATYLTQPFTATRTARLEVKTLDREAALDLPATDENAQTGAIDPTGRYAYYTNNTPTDGYPAQVVKVDLKTMQRVGAINLLSSENTNSALIDPAGRYLYLGGNLSVIKIDLQSFQRVATLALNLPVASGYYGELISAVIEPAGRFAYFGATTGHTTIVKIDLATFQPAGSLVLPDSLGQLDMAVAVMDPAGHSAYFGTNAGPDQGRVVKIDLDSLQVAGSLPLEADDGYLGSAAIDPAGRFAYFGGSDFTNGDRVIKVDLDSLQRVGAVPLPHGMSNLNSAVIDPNGSAAYFGVNLTGDPTYASYINPDVVLAYAYYEGRADGVVKVDLSRFELITVYPLATGDTNPFPALMAPDGSHAYFRTGPATTTVGTEVETASYLAGSRAGAGGGITWPGDVSPDRVVKMSLTRPSKAALAAAADGPVGYETPYATPLSKPAPGVLGNDEDTEDHDPLTAGQASDPAHGSVVLSPDGSFTYTPDAGFFGYDTFIYTASDGMDFSAPATVTVRVLAPPAGVQATSGGAFGFSTNVSLFGGPAETRGPRPSVVLPVGGGDVSASDPDGDVGQYGPAYIFESHGPLTVHSSGVAGLGGSVTGSASVRDISDNDPFHAGGSDGEASSSCSATETGLSGSARIVNGRLVTSTDVTTGEPTSEVTFPHVFDPAPNTQYEGSLDHVGDRYRIVFNEQVLAPDSITVNAVHMYLLGPTAVGDMVIGQSRCAVDLAGPNSAPVAADDTYRAAAGQTLSVPAGGVLANDTDGDGQPLRAATVAPVPPPSSGGGAWTFPSDPAHGTVNLKADGSFSYTPNAGYVGPDSFTYLAQDPRGKSDLGTVAVTVEQAVARVSAVADFDGNGSSDVAVYRPDSAAWFVQGGLTTGWGIPGDVPVPADYDGNGTTDVAVFRPSDQSWYVQGGLATQWGAPGDIPIPGDYDGDGDADIAVFRPSDQTWYVQGGLATQWGTNGDIPVPGDYDGNGTTDIAVFRPSDQTWYVQGGLATQWGTNGDVPVPADFNGDGKTDVAVFRPSDQTSYSQGPGGIATQWGANGDKAVAADYNGDGTTDVAVYRPSDQTWYVQGGLSTQWGNPGDIPLAVPAHLRTLYGL